MAKIEYTTQELIRGLMGPVSGSNQIVKVTKTGRIKLVEQKTGRERRKEKRKQS